MVIKVSFVLLNGDRICVAEAREANTQTEGRVSRSREGWIGMGEYGVDEKGGGT